MHPLFLHFLYPEIKREPPTKNGYPLSSEVLLLTVIKNRSIYLSVSGDIDQTHNVNGHTACHRLEQVYNCFCTNNQNAVFGRGFV